MRSEQLNYLLEAINCQSLNAAAEKLFLTQPALSKSIKSLEKELGIPLLIRHTGGVEVTEHAKHLAPVMEELLTTLALLQKDLDAYLISCTHEGWSDFNDELTLFAPDSIARFLLPEKIKIFNQIAPQVKIHLTQEDHFVDALQLLDTNTEIFFFLNINDFYRSSPWPAHITYQALLPQKLFALVNPNSALAKKESLNCDDLVQYQWVKAHYSLSLNTHLSNILGKNINIKTPLITNNPTIYTYYIQEHPEAIFLMANATARSSALNFSPCILVPIEDARLQLSLDCLFKTNHPKIYIINAFLQLLTDC